MHRFSVCKEVIVPENEHLLHIEAIRVYSEVAIPALTIDTADGALISPTNHLFVRGRYVPTGIISPYDDKYLSPARQIYLYAKARYITKPLIHKGCYIWVYDIFSGNYYHWMCEALPRILMLHKHNEDAVVALPITLKKYPYVKEALELLNIAYEWIDAGKANLYEKLLMIKTTPPIGDIVNPIAQLGLSKVLKECVFRTGKGSRKIYISRASAQYRKITNENDLIILLKQKGYEILLAEEISFQKQVELFTSVSSLICLHGAGETNMMFMQAGGKVLEIRNSNWHVQPLCYFGLANIFGLKWDYFLASEEESNFSDLILDISEFEQKLLNFEEE